MIEQVRVQLGPRSYTIRITSEPNHDMMGFVRQSYPKLTQLFVVSDDKTILHAERVSQLAQVAGIRCTNAVVRSGEESKCFAEVIQLCDQLAELPADRQTVVLAVGGGVIGDLVGFAASIYNRGLPFFQIPTTLLAMVDSSVGGKVGINHTKGKNLIGSFHQPVGVWIDTSMLQTLPDREFRSGLAEVVKYGVILDETFFRFLEDKADAILKRDAQAIVQIVKRSCELKAQVVEQDEREETGLRMILNYGHTFAHAFENIAGYGTWLHGEAVAAGMICASKLAEKQGLMDPAITQRQVDLLQRFQLPVWPLQSWPIDDLIISMYRDKKTKAGKLRFVLPTKLGEVKTFDNIAEAHVREVLQQR